MDAQLETGHTVRIMFDESPIGMCSALADGTILRKNAAFERLTSGSALSVFDLFPPEKHAELGMALTAIASGNDRVFACEAELATTPGRWCELSGVAMSGTGHVMLHAIDVTERRRREDHLRALAERDPLTGLGNRLTFNRSLAARLRSGPGATVMLLDLDGFKAVNDTCGHQRGDAVLCAIAAAITNAMPIGSTIARLGGDEFAVLLEVDAREATAIGTRLITRIMIAAATVVRTPRVTASIGIAPLLPGSDLEALLAAVDRAMYAAKRAGKARCQMALTAMPTSYTA